MAKSRNTVEKQIKLKPGDLVLIISGCDEGCYGIILFDKSKLKDIEYIYIFNNNNKTFYYTKSLKKLNK